MFKRFNPLDVAKRWVSSLIDDRIRAYGALRQSDLGAAIKRERERN